MAETDVTEDTYIATKDLPITFKVRNEIIILTASFYEIVEL